MLQYCNINISRNFAHLHETHLLHSCSPVSSSQQPIGSVKLVSMVPLPSRPVAQPRPPPRRMNEFLWDMLCLVCKAYKKQTLAVLFVLLEVISVILEIFGKNTVGSVLASFVLSAFGVVVTLYTTFVMGKGIGNGQLVVVEIVFSFVQLIVTYIDLIMKFTRTKCNYKVSLFPLAFALIALVFAFKINPVDSPNEQPAAPELSSSVITTPRSSVTCTSGMTQLLQLQQRSSSSKTCQVEGCGKGARGASGRCISHGGGRRCQKHGCHKGAEGRTVYCKAHGGGRRCEHRGCTKSAEGRTDYCIAHGGGRRCSYEGCSRAARGKSGLCIRHGGGKRCQKENCTKSAEGLSGLCISHGGGRRCQALDCTKGAQGSTMFCKAHGGGKRCTIIGCTKGAEGSTTYCKGHGDGKRCGFPGGGVCWKSVRGGTNFCVAHGGGKRCALPECTKSARGRTDFCVAHGGGKRCALPECTRSARGRTDLYVRHGGGKRCKFEGYGKSSYGSTDFCKAHGGGKRCSWGHPGSEYGSQPTGPCNSFARGKTGLCALHVGLVQDERVHGGVTLGPMVQDPKLDKPEKMKEVAIDDMNMEIVMGSSAYSDFKKAPPNVPNPQISVRGGGLSPLPAFVPEGRVHGGSLVAMLAGSSSLVSNSSPLVPESPA